MTTMATGVRINTSQRLVLYRGFIIQEAYVTGKGNVWEWAHEDYGQYGSPHHDVTGDCQTLFECIEAVDNWHDNQAEADYLARQQSLMESGGRDDSAYRRDMIAAGRGHLLGGA